MSGAKKSTGRVIGGDVNITDAETYVEIQKAGFKVERYKRHFDISADQQTSIAKWLNASLFAINAGGILTVLNNTQALCDIQIPGFLFVVGIVMSLLNATINQEIYSRISEPILDMVDYWSEVTITGIKDDEAHKKIESKMKNIKKCFWVGPVFGWISGLLFIAGAISVAANLK